LIERVITARPVGESGRFLRALSRRPKAALLAQLALDICTDGLAWIGSKLIKALAQRLPQVQLNRVIVRCLQLTG
jgi:hypothetical protein